MSTPFVAEIRIFACNFAPKNWAQCNGQLLSIPQNTALFSLLGTTYGGDGKSTYALPDMQGNVPMHWGQSTTGTQYVQGQQSGSQFVTLLQSEIPVHTHNIQVSSQQGDLQQPVAAGAIARPNGATPFTNQLTGAQPMGFQELSTAGGSLPHNNMMPYLTLLFCIALLGVFPARP